MKFVAPNTGIPAATGLQLSETTQDTLNHDTVDADAVSGISTGIAYDHEHNSFFPHPPDTEFRNFFSDKKTLTTESRCRGRVRVAKHNHHIGQSLIRISAGFKKNVNRATTQVMMKTGKASP